MPQTIWNQFLGQVLMLFQMVCSVYLTVLDPKGLYIRGGQMVKSFNITSKITSFCLKGYNKSYKIGLLIH